MAKWLACIAVALLAFHFSDARAAPSLSDLHQADNMAAITVLIGSKKKGSATTNSAQASRMQKKKQGFWCPTTCSCGCEFLRSTCKICIPR